jgi:hypothetical protein
LEILKFKVENVFLFVTSRHLYTKDVLLALPLLHLLGSTQPTGAGQLPKRGSGAQGCQLTIEIK